MMTQLGLGRGINVHGGELKVPPDRSRWIQYPARLGHCLNSPPILPRSSDPYLRIAAMLRRSASTEKSFGYLTTVETGEFGYFGGYLIVSSLGRPLEFHCTAPIQPSRAQRILYGPTLASYLLGEQICGALSGVAKLTPELILTDCDVALHARNRFAVPMALVTAVELMKSVDGLNQTAHEASGATHHAAAVPIQQVLGVFTIGPNQFRLPDGYEGEQHTVEEAVALLAQRVELTEPFGRIREAIDEAQRIGGGGTDANDQAA
jgi:hypothetical protein